MYRVNIEWIMELFVCYRHALFAAFVSYILAVCSSDSMFYALTLCALQIDLTITITMYLTVLK